MREALRQGERAEERRENIEESTNRDDGVNVVVIVRR